MSNPTFSGLIAEITHVVDRIKYHDEKYSNTELINLLNGYASDIELLKDTITELLANEVDAHENRVEELEKVAL